MSIVGYFYDAVGKILLHPLPLFRCIEIMGGVIKIVYFHRTAALQNLSGRVTYQFILLGLICNTGHLQIL